MQMKAKRHTIPASIDETSPVSCPPNPLYLYPLMMTVTQGHRKTRPCSSHQPCSSSTHAPSYPCQPRTLYPATQPEHHHKQPMSKSATPMLPDQSMQKANPRKNVCAHPEAAGRKRACRRRSGWIDLSVVRCRESCPPRTKWTHCKTRRSQTLSRLVEYRSETRRRAELSQRMHHTVSRGNFRCQVRPKWQV